MVPSLIAPLAVRLMQAVIDGHFKESRCIGKLFQIWHCVCCFDALAQLGIQFALGMHEVIERVNDKESRVARHVGSRSGIDFVRYLYQLLQLWRLALMLQHIYEALTGYTGVLILWRRNQVITFNSACRHGERVSCNYRGTMLSYLDV